MTKYFMNLRDGTEELLDPDGVEYDSLDALRKAVLSTVRDLMCGDIIAGVIDFRFRIDAEDADGVIVYTLPFEHAVNMALSDQRGRWDEALLAPSNVAQIESQAV